MNAIERNRAAWNRESTTGSEWSTPVPPAVIDAARRGDWSVVLTPRRPVPAAWLGELRGREVLCLASGGGQQAPVLAAAGARVVSYDLSEVQLAKDQAVAERHGLDVRCVRGDMTDLSRLESSSFDLVFHPISNVFVPAVQPVWRECHRVLRPGGRLLAGFMNPSFFLFDHDAAAREGVLIVRHALPYRDPESRSGDDRRRWEESGSAAEFGHSLEDQLAGQLRAGLRLLDLYEDHWSSEATPLDRFSPTSIATLAVRPAESDRGDGPSTRAIRDRP